MATADELLSGVSSVDNTFVIDSDLRTIRIPSSVTNLGVESDDDVMRVKFRMPSEYCGIDLSTFKIRINYLNAIGEGDVYDVTDVTKINGTTLTFSWLIGRHASAYKGNLTFNVCMKDVASDGTVRREFNTTIATKPILEGLEVSEQAIVEYTDIFEQWRSMLFGVGDTEEQRLIDTSTEQQENIAEKGAEVLATIPEDYTTTYNNADEAVRTKGDAIVQSVQGDVITVNDSSDDHLRGLHLFGKTTQVTTTGKNLLNVEETFTLSQTKGFPVSLPAGSYIVSITSETHSGDQQPYLRFYTNNVWIQLKNNHAQTAVLTADETMVYLYTYGMSASESDGVTATFTQLMVSTSGGAYEPYSGGVASPSPEWPQPLNTVGDGVNTTVTVYGKNLLEPRATSSSGYTAVVNADGSVTVTGSATTTSSIYLTIATPSATNPLKLSKGKKYFMWGESTNGKYIGTKTLNDAGDAQWSTASTWNKHVGTEYTNIAQIYVESNGHVIGDTSLCGTYRFQLELGDEFTGFEGYKPPQTIIPAATGLPGIPVASGGNYTDPNGQQWVCDEIDFERGIYVQRTKLINLAGCPNWYTWGVNNRIAGYTGFYHYYEGLGNDVLNAVCSIAPYKGDLWGGNGFGAYSTKSGKQYIAVCLPNSYLADVSTNDLAVESFKNMCAETEAKLLVTWAPVETALTAEEIETFRAVHTNYPNTTIVNDSDMYMKASYNADTKLYITNTMTSVLEGIENGSY